MTKYTRTACALLVCVCGPMAAHGQQLISNLPFDGSLVDTVSGQAAVFARPSNAYGPDATLFRPDVPRFETVAVATGAVVSVGDTAKPVPIAILPDMLIGVRGLEVYSSTDGENFVLRGELPDYMLSMAYAYGTPNGALLVMLRDNRLWRSGDGGQSFEPVLQFPAGSYPRYWNFAALGATVFASEYGDKYQTDNPRRIYRSRDDGATWEVVYNPSPTYGYHCHKIVAEPSTGRVYQSIGDLTKGILLSEDLGETWTLIHDYYQPTAAVARPEAVYWGHDGDGAASVQRLDMTTGQWTWPLQPWRGYVNGQSFAGNIFTMADYGGVIYTDFMTIDELWVSRDGLHWALAAGPPTGLGDAHSFLGGFAGRVRGWVCDNPLFVSVSITPPAVANVVGLRLEPGVENQPCSPSLSSFEDGLGDYTVTSPTTLVWDTTQRYHGSASARWTIPVNTGPATLRLAALPVALPAGAHVYGQIHVRGDERVLRVSLRDEMSGLRGPLTIAGARDEWGLVRVEMDVTQPTNSIQLEIYAPTLPDEETTTIWLDGCQIAAAQSGETWQLGGTPRASEVLTLPVAFPAAWTDAFCVTPSFSSTDSFAVPRTFRAWVQDVDHYATLAFDPVTARFTLREMAGGNVTELCASEPAEFWPGWACRVVVRSAPGGADFHVQVGTRTYAGTGPPLTVQASSLWIGSSPAGDDGAPGVYALSRSFAGWALDGALPRLLDWLPGTTPTVDCNGNGIGDVSDIAGGTSGDMDWDGIPDECEPDCDQNGQPDDFDIANGTPDCNGNGRPDTCDLADGVSLDANANGVPDECDPDCNGNGVPDDVDILSGFSEDADGDGLPDECAPLVGDLNCDGNVGFGDINSFVLRLCDPAAYRAEYPLCPDANGDINGNGLIGFDDINPFVTLLLGGK